MKRILLVSPRRGFDMAEKSETSTLRRRMRAPGALMPPLDLATVKGLTPPGFQVDIWDESVRGPISDETEFACDYDLLGVTAYNLHLPWALRMCDLAHRRGIPALIGGPGVSGSPDVCRGKFDVLFLGEAEQTWPQFLEDWSLGRHKPEYRQVQRPDLNDTALPDWTGFEEMGNDYFLGAVQTTRGCPFDCEFCDVIHLFGRRPRHKAVDTVLAEVEGMAGRGMRSVFFCDDNFIGQPKYAKELLRGLIPLNNSFKRPLGFSTQLTIDLAADDELLELMTDANFHWVLIGIESPREASLREANKPQNLKRDLVESVRKIQSHGIMVKGNMIVGFDHDDPAIFEEMYEFLRKCAILNVTVSLLKAFPGTPLAVRMQKEGRLIETDGEDYAAHPRAMTNIIPKQMTRVELFAGYKWLLDRIHSWEYAGHCATDILNRIERLPAMTGRRRGLLRSVVTRLLLSRGGGLAGGKRPGGLPGLLEKLPRRKSSSRAQQMETVNRLIEALDPQAQAIIRDVLRKAWLKSPIMLERMVLNLLRFGAVAVDLPRFLAAIQRRIDLESTPDFEVKINRSHPHVPRGFRQAIQGRAFPQTCEWLMAGMRDRQHVAAGLIEVWKRFLIRWGATFEKLEDYHMEHLRELCERTNEQEAAGQFDHATVRAELDELSAAQLRRLAEEVLVAVEQDLRGCPDQEFVPLGHERPGRASGESNLPGREVHP